MLKRLRVLGGASLLLVTLFASDLYAQGARTIHAGETHTLVSGPDPIVITGGAIKGKSVVITTESPTGSGGTPAKTFALQYTAPATTNEVFTETIAYTNPAARTFAVTVIPPGSDQVYNEAFKALFVVFVIALLLESGLAILFNWRPFVVTFDGRGVKTVVSVLFAFTFVYQFRLDIVTRLVNIYSQTTPPFTNSFTGYMVTALVIAGGSAAVNTLMVALGFRSVRTADVIAPKPPKTEGWISVTLNRNKAVGPVDVLIGDPAAGPPVAGTIIGGPRRSAFVRFFLRDDNRFPLAGGFAVPTGSTCVVHIEGRDANGASMSNKWGPHTIAPGAIIDLVLEL